MISYIDNHTDSQKSYRNILAYIIKKGKTTRREIQQQTNYSWSSVSSVVAVLINKKHVIETDSVNRGVGRGTSYIIPNGEKLVSIGIDINSIGFSLTLIGIDGTVKYTSKKPFEIISKEGMMNLVYEMIDDAIKFIDDRYVLTSIGVSCQGKVDLEHKTLIKYPFCKEIVNLNIKQLLEEKYGVHVFLEHDTNCLLEDYTHRYDDKTKSLCIVRIVSGIGFTICVNGQSLEEFGTIDLGHFIVQPKGGPFCDCCKNYGCLESFASTEGVARRAGVSFDIIDQNRDQYREYLDDAAFYLGVTFANILNVFDLEAVVVTGNIIGDDTTLLNKIQETCKQFELEKKVVVTYIKDLSASLGVARLALIHKIETGEGL